MQRHSYRQLLVTEDVRWFIEKCSATDKCQALLGDIHQAMTQGERDVCIQMSRASGFLIFILGPAESDGPERVVVWHGPTDGGVFYTPTILKRTVPYDCGFA